MPRDRAVPKTGLGPETQGCRGQAQRLTLFGDSKALWYNLCMKPLNRLIAFALILVFLLPVQLCHAWSEGGHHLIAAVAFSLLTEKEQAELIAVLQKHPRYAEDFVPSEKLPNEEEKIRWLVGRSGYWPDVAQRQPIYHRWKVRPSSQALPRIGLLFRSLVLDASASSSTRS